MGLLSRLWSLNATGCSLHEPLRSMLAGGKYKSADIVGYLKSVLHAATRYTRMKLMFVGQQVRCGLKLVVYRCFASNLSGTVDLTEIKS